MIHLRSVRLDRSGGLPPAFPFSVPVIAALPEIVFTSEVTVFVGENGSGKSTLLEALAVAIGSITVGSDQAGADQTLAGVRDLAERLKLVWNKRTRKGFFLRSEDFFGYVRRLAHLREELEGDLRRVDTEYRGRSQAARDLARLPHANELSELNRRYGGDLDTRSHGESYLTLFQSRFVPGGLYLLDEPEAPLSPSRQLSLLAMLHAMAAENAQFIIATHSPILMAYPGAAILSFDGGALHHADYDSLEHVDLMRGFLNHPQDYLCHLLRE